MEIKQTKLNHYLHIMEKKLSGRYVKYLLSKNDIKGYYAFQYKCERHKKLDFEHPKDLAEIWISKYLSGYFDRYYYLADKYEVRKFVEERIGRSYLINLLGVWDRTEEINFSVLPNQFALKVNFGSKMNLICTDKKTLNIDEAIKTLNNWMAVEHYSLSEHHYDKIPHKLVCEEFIQDNHGGLPIDYKFMCFHGRPYCILACGSREKGEPTYTPYTLDWKPVKEYRKDGHYEDITKPTNLDKMIEIAKKLSNGFDLMRVDLYDTGEKILFGEMTLTPTSCLFSEWTQMALDDMGKVYRNEYN